MLFRSAKAARSFDALRIKREAETGAPAAPVEAAPAAEAAPEVVAEAAPAAEVTAEETSAEPAQAEATPETPENA